MQCRSVLTRIDALRTGELERGDSVEVESHLHTCGSCHDSLTDVENFATAVRSLAAPRRPGQESLVSTLCDSFDSIDVDGTRVWIAYSSNGVRAVDMRASTADEFRKSYGVRCRRELRQQPVPERYRKAVAAALRGELSSAPDVDLTGRTDFEQTVLRIIAEIPRGEVRTYEWVAREAGRPKAVRAVGNIMASNPVPLVLPCHRVVPTSGGIGNYGYGPAMKRKLLAAEGTPVEELETLAREGVRYVGSRTTKIFCFPTCRDARRIRDANKVGFHDLGETRELGYRPCKRCTPAVAA
ncbi:MAG TPA: methylated-DNA--[protein]-cysteine S-methyltransferase [Thermoanaerobaculia bacterium]|nr:methylated-DNA--[protein]-cysteine S-methyltransferase [Thermoanaerobaculia bacterium]